MSLYLQEFISSLNRFHLLLPDKGHNTCPNCAAAFCTSFFLLMYVFANVCSYTELSLVLVLVEYENHYILFIFTSINEEKLFHSKSVLPLNSFQFFWSFDLTF